MSNIGLRFVSAAVTTAFLACTAGQASTQPPAPATPNPPTAVKTPAAGTVSTSTSTRVDQIIANDLAQVRQTDAKTAGVMNQYTQAFSLSGRSSVGLPDKRQNIDLADVPLKEALKRVLDDSKIPYVLDDDVPSEPKVTIKLTNAPLATILDALTLSSRIGWRTELKQTTTIPSNTKPSEPSGKTDPAKEAGGSTTRNRLNTTFGSIFVTNGSISVLQIHVGKTITAVPSFFPFGAVTIPEPPPNPAQDALRGRVVPGSPQYRIYRWQSQKRSFTCPRCHNTISILQEHEDVKCTKCQRAFEDSWKVCPYDGTKRPESKTAWKYCPICGKGITIEAKWSEPMGITDYLRFTAPVDFEIEQPLTQTLQYLPSLMNELDGLSGHGCGNHEHDDHAEHVVSA